MGMATETDALGAVRDAQRAVDAAQSVLSLTVVKAVEAGHSSRAVAKAARGVANQSWVYSVLRRAGRADLVRGYQYGKRSATGAELAAASMVTPTTEPLKA